MTKVSLSLIPFFITVALYFKVHPSSLPVQCVIKVLPIVSLKIFVLLSGIGLSKQYYYRWTIITALVFSAAGDAFLVWQDVSPYFDVGLGTFGVAHLFYTFAFGWSPLRLLIGLPYLIFAIVTISVIAQYTTGIMTFLVALYAILICVMAWRASARVEITKNVWQNLPKIFGCIGAVVFLVSDLVLAVNKFISPVPHFDAINMSTYYSAQMFIALSVLECEEEVSPEAQSEEGQQVEMKEYSGTPG